MNDDRAEELAAVRTAMPPVLRELLDAELEAGNTITGIGRNYPAPRGATYGTLRAGAGRGVAARGGAREEAAVGRILLGAQPGGGRRGGVPPAGGGAGALRRPAETRGAIAVSIAALLAWIHGAAQEPFDWALRPLFLRFNTEDRSEREAALHDLCELMGVEVPRNPSAESE